MKRYVVSMLAGLVFVGSLVAQSDILGIGRSKYEAAKSKIDADTLVSYSNALAAAMAPLKQKGDLETFLAIQKELERVSAERTIGSTNSPVGIIVSSAVKFGNEQALKTQVLVKQYMTHLEGLMKTAMQADKINDAKEIKGEIDRVKFELADLDSKTVKVVAPAVVIMAKTNEPAKVSVKKGSFFGTWSISDNAETMEFTQNGKVIARYPDKTINEKSGGRWIYVAGSKTKIKRTCNSGAVRVYDYDSATDELVCNKQEGTAAYVLIRVDEKLK